MIVIKSGPSNLVKIEKRVNDSIIYKFECKDILDTHELIASVSVPSVEGATVTDVRSRAGTQIEFRVSNQSIGTSVYVDINLEAYITTIFSNIRTIPIQVRVYK